MRVEIPGGSAELREKISVRGRMIENSYWVGMGRIFRKLPLNAEPGAPIDARHLTPVEGTRLWGWQNALIASRLKSWTLPFDVPTTVGEVEESEAFLDDEEGRERYNLLAAAASKLWWENRRPTFDPTPDKDSPTEPSLASEASASEGDQESSISPSPTSGESSSTEAVSAA